MQIPSSAFQGMLSTSGALVNDHSAHVHASKVFSPNSRGPHTNRKLTGQCHIVDFRMVSSWICALWLLCLLPLALTIRHDRNLIWAQTPAMRLTVSRLVGIEGDPDAWVSTKKPNVKHISAPHYRWEFKALGFSYRKQLLVWSEAMNKRIQSLMLNGATETTDVFPGTSEQVVGLTVDWLSSNVYWGDGLYNWIMMSPLQQPVGKHVYRIVLQEGLDNPHGMAVYPNKGYLFFSDWGVRPRIERCDLLCKQKQIVVDTKISHPRGLAVDVVGERLYWVDSDRETVESILFDGTDRKVMVTDPDTSFFGIALFKQNGVLKVYEEGKAPVSFTLGNIPYGIVMYDDSQQPGDSGPCDNAGCEHMCVLDPISGPFCICGNGYNLSADGKHCEFGKQFVHPSHLYAIGVAICQYPANIPDMSLENVTLTSQCFLNDRYGYLALTFDARENMLYYSGNFTNTISAIPLEVGANAKVVAGGTGVVKGLALDWMTGNLYWTDSTNGYIKVARKDGAFQRVLLDKDVNNPLGIAVHPARGKIYWTDIGSPPEVESKVECANMDGTERKVILKGSDGAGQPNHLFIDMQKNELLWADSAQGMIRRYSLDGGSVDVFYHMKDVKFYGISVFRDFLLWTDTDEMNGIHMARIDLGRKVRGIIHPKYGVASDVITFDISHQPNQTTEDTRVPAALASPCLKMVTAAFQKQVYQVNTKNGVVSALGLKTKHEPIALDFNPVTSHVYWSDNNAHLLARTTLKSGTTQTVRLLPETSVCDGIAVDYINQLLFYTETGNDVIGVTSLIHFDHHVTIIKGSLDEPRDIVVSPTDAYIFWSDWGSEPKISRAMMDGSDIKTLINFTTPAWPNGLALDVKGRMLYYADAQNNAIGTYNIDTGVQRIMINEPAAHYFGLFVMGDFLYLTDWRRNYVARMHKLGGVVMQFGPSDFTKLYGVSGFNSSEVLRGTSVCRNNSCDHICVPTPLNVQRCLCSDGFSAHSTWVHTHLPPTSTAEATSSAPTATTTAENHTGKRVPPVRTPNITDPIASPSQTKSNSKDVIIAVVTVTALVVLIAFVVAGIIYYRRRSGYTVPHARLDEDNSTTYPKAFYPHREQETVTFDSGIENPTYDVTQAMLSNGTNP
ncbi:hypothetical protein BaRGS_00034178 [Batillaria attramentaria]|uniref:EGF-like domain-containing protein n=1 Tax=Batillaria attramentaria TaxID=370345 RepID=A0ABD0JI33_9CAEN